MRPRLALALAVTTTLAAAACSFIVENAGPLACSQEGRLGPPACDAGLICRQGLCQAIEDADGGAGPESSSPGGAGVGGGEADAEGRP